MKNYSKENNFLAQMSKRLIKFTIMSLKFYSFIFTAILIISRITPREKIKLQAHVPPPHPLSTKLLIIFTLMKIENVNVMYNERQIKTCWQQGN